MTPIQNLYTALGELAYAIACADGEVKKAERQKFHDIVAEEIKSDQYGFDFSLIIFQIMDKKNISAMDAYVKAIQLVRSNSHYLSSELIETILKVMEKVAEAYPPITQEERELVQKFKTDVALAREDSMFYISKKF